MPGVSRTIWGGAMSERDHARARMERAIERRNASTRAQSDCAVCGEHVPDRDFPTKFMQAGGVLAGPFCSPECHWGFLMEDWP